ncbi:hypothetical protein IG631_15191 [Alternaria alternata]|nr:hypothetical protein IG631_15191 [Alternaria alternata]
MESSHTKYRSILNFSASSFLLSTKATSDPAATTTVATIPMPTPIAAKPRIVKQVYPVKIVKYMTRKKSKKRSSDRGFIASS